MPVKKLREFLDANKIKYIAISHSPAFTAQQIAASAHIPGKDVAKTVIIKIDGKMAMAVLSASCKIDFEMLKFSIGAKKIDLAAERDFKDLFPECEIGAMPPFGNLYGMDVYVAKKLADEIEIAFNAGSHTELIKLAYADFERLVRPIVVRCSTE